MSKYTDSVQKIADTAATNLKIKPPVFTDRASIPSARGVGNPGPVKTDICNILYTTRDNSYDIGAILNGTSGPKLNNKCDHIDTITGLTDIQSGQSTDTFGEEITLIIQVDGVFT